MELILTSFGLSHLPRRHHENPDVFYRMPPVSMSIVNQGFMPDYAALLLCDRVILDSESWERLSKGEHYRGYGEVAEVMKVLYDEGFVRVEDFDNIVDNNREMLERMLERDLKRLDDWVQPLRESLQTWRDFVESMDSLLRRDIIAGREEALTDKEPTQEDIERRAAYQHMAYYLHDLHGHASYAYSWYYLLQKAIESSTKRRCAEYRAALREELAEYLAYVNANLVVSHTLEAGFHDWYDFAPFYREKFLTIGQEETLEQKRIEKVKQLFEVSFPEFTFWDAKSIVKALKDERISDLRNLVDKAAKEEVNFNREFANRILQEVLGIERRIGHLRNIVSYVTLPIGFVPWVGTPVQKGLEELVSRVAESKAKKEFRWFYLISELGRNLQPPQLNKKWLPKEIDGV